MAWVIFHLIELALMIKGRARYNVYRYFRHPKRMMSRRSFPNHWNVQADGVHEKKPAYFVLHQPLRLPLISDNQSLKISSVPGRKHYYSIKMSSTKLEHGERDEDWKWLLVG